MTPICNKEKLNEGTDLKRVALLFVRKLWLVLIAVVAGVVLGALLYKVYARIVDSEPTYMSSTDYYITFNLGDYPDGMDYYNAYTWGEFVKDDKIIENVLKELPSDYEKQEVLESVSIEMPSDFRVLSVVIKGKNKSRVEAISKAYESAMPKFVDEVKELTEIALWSSNDTTIISNYDKTGNAAFLGGLVALVLALLFFAGYYALDDRIYTEADFNRFLGDIPFIGYDSEGYRTAYDANYKAVVGDREVYKCADITENLENIGKTGAVVLEIAWGKTCATQIRYDIDLLKKQSYELVGVSMKDCNEKFLKVYYGRNK